MEFVSVVIPTYNRGNLIIRAINSVLEQTYSNIEVIVVDDCSSDNTREIVQSIKDNRVRYLCLEKNMGACAARNRGIEASRGEYIAFQDSDDEWLPNKLEIQLSEMKKNSASVSFCSFYKINENLGMKTIFPQKVISGFIDYKTLLTKSIVSTQCIVAKRECFEDTKFDPQMPRLQDWDIILSLAQKYKVFHVDQPLVNMYVQEESISAHPEKGIIALLRLWEKHGDALEKNDAIKREWNIYLGNYKLSNGDNPVTEFKNALRIKFSKDIFVKYIMAKLGIINRIYKSTGRI